MKLFTLNNIWLIPSNGHIKLLANNQWSCLPWIISGCFLPTVIRSVFPAFLMIFTASSTSLHYYKKHFKKKANICFPAFYKFLITIKANSILSVKKSSFTFCFDIIIIIIIIIIKIKFCINIIDEQTRRKVLNKS